MTTTATPTPGDSDDDPLAVPRLTRLTVRPWHDPVVDDRGHHPRSRYVETFWLGVLGPTATWLLRRLTAGLDRAPEGYELDLAATAQAMGLGFAEGRSSPFAKALQRCVMFGLAHPLTGGLAVRRRIPPVAQRHLRRMPPEVQAAHAAWDTGPLSADDLASAHGLALTLRDAGVDTDVLEHQLVALGVSTAVAAEVADNMLRLAG